MLLLLLSLQRKKIADGLNVRLVLKDGVDLAKLIIKNSVAVQVKETIKVAKIDQDILVAMSK